MKNDKITVGVLIGNICASHSDDMLNGLVHRAADCDVQTLFFMGHMPIVLMSCIIMREEIKSRNIFFNLIQYLIMQN